MARLSTFFDRCLGPVAPLRVEQPSLEGEAARSRERHRRAILSSLASALARVVAIGALVISVPLTLTYLGTERYGMWMTISSLIAMLSFADLGMGSGLLNKIAHAHGKGDVAAIRRLVSSGFLMFGLIALLVLLVFAVVYPRLSWSSIFNVQGDLAKSEAGPTLAVFVGLFALNIPLGIVGRLQTGLQQSFKVSLWQCAGSLVALTSMMAVIYLKGGLPWLVGAALGAPTVAVMCNSMDFFFRARPDLCPRRSEISGREMRHLMHTGALFLVLQIVAAVAYGSDNVVIAHSLGASAVTEYAVPEKLFGLIAVGIGIALAPLWPAYGEALSCGDVRWVRSVFIRSLLVAIGSAAVISIILVLLAPKIITLWVGHVVNTPFLLLAGLGLWKIIEAGGNAMAMLLNGANVIRAQLFAGVLTGLSALALKVVLVDRIGVAGAVWASIIAFSVFSIVPLSVWAVPKALGIRPTESEGDVGA
jgi:O-antigen/teichoic acid export membrane protein